jgi:monoamine oxidase
MAPPPHLPPTGKRVLIIGVGFAGLAAAHKLRSDGYEVLVLEARCNPVWRRQGAWRAGMV